ncbi:MAG: ABC transporter permease [Acidimicrobiales bacterium]
MSHATYLRYEVIRTFRNRRFFIFSLAFPLIILLAVAGANRHGTVESVSLPLYFMTGMVAFGTMIAVISAGARISNERQLGWTRQLRITPMRPRTYFGAKVLTGYLMAIFTIVILYLAGSALGVRLDARQWAVLTLIVLVGLVPFVLLGILAGHLLKPDSLGPAVGGVTSLFALVSGAWGPLSTGPGYVEVIKCIPSYWLVQSGRVVAFGGSSGWPPAEAWIVIAVWSVVLARLAFVAYRRDTARV